MKKEANKERIYLSSPHMGSQERELLLDAFDSNWIAPLGPHVNAFEEEFATMHGSDVHACAVSSGSAGLHLALVMLGVEANDTVFASSFTFAATINPIKYVGADAVLIDSDHETWNMCPIALEKAFQDAKKRGKLPKAIIIADLYGQCANYSKILPICRKYEVPVIQDAAESLGAFHNEEAAGLQGDIGIFSFNGNKIITTSGGGMLISRNKKWTDKARYLATQAREPFPHYEHVEVGYNYRLSNLLAAVGRGQLMNLKDRIAARKRNFAYYKKAFKDTRGISFIPFGCTGEPNYWLSCILIEDQDMVNGSSKAAMVNGKGSAINYQSSTINLREAVRLALEAENIESRPLWKPMHLQPVYKECPFYGPGVSEELFKTGLCLPSGSNLSENDLKRICDIVKKTIA